MENRPSGHRLSGPISLAGIAGQFEKNKSEEPTSSMSPELRKEMNKRRDEAG